MAAVPVLVNLDIRLVPGQTEAALEVWIFGAICRKRASLNCEQIKGEVRLDAVQIHDRHDATHGDLRYHLDRMGNVAFLLDADGDGIEKYHSLEGLDQEAFGLSSMARPVTPVPSSGLAVAVFPQRTKRFIRSTEVANRLLFRVVQKGDSKGSDEYTTASECHQDR